MAVNKNWRREQSFTDSSDSATGIALQSQLEAADHLHSLLGESATVGLLHGPALSGKSTIVRQFVKGLPANVAVSIVDGSGLTAEQLLSTIVADFGYRVELQSTDDLLRMVQVIAVQQTRSHQAPIVVVENIERMNPAALEALCQVSELTYQGQHAVRIVCTGNERSPQLVKSEGLASLARRGISPFAVLALSPRESLRYLHSRLLAAGANQPDSILPMNVCDRLHELSGGLPGLLNRNAARVLDKAGTLPVSTQVVDEALGAATREPAVPELIVSTNGKIVHRYKFREKKVTVGRSSLADLVIDDDYASKFHALFMLYRDALVLIDLNSSNGTFVNSVKIKNAVLRSDDIISVSHHRIKVLNAPEASDRNSGQYAVPDTSKMKTIAEMRRQSEQRHLRIAGRKKK